jgi:hypothetical protein
MLSYSEEAVALRSERDTSVPATWSKSLTGTSEHSVGS